MAKNTSICIFLYLVIVFLLCMCLDTDWFPGWSRKHGREPSSRTPTEDCVELRQSFPGLVNVEPNDIVSDDVLPTKVVKNQLYWNDQECRQENWFVCSKRITNPSTRKEKHKIIQKNVFMQMCIFQLRQIQNHSNLKRQRQNAQ